jgi:hypothetical protein
METLIAAFITGGLALLGTVITVNASNKKTENTVKTELAVMNTEIKNLRTEVEKHNNFAVRVPALENQTKSNTDAIHRLENFHME